MYLATQIQVREHLVAHKSGKKILKKFKSRVHHLRCDACEQDFTRLQSEMDKRRANNLYKHFCDVCKDPAMFAELGRGTYRNNLLKKIGEKSIDECGYIRVYVGDTHPYCEAYGGAIREHIVVMENHLKRALRKGEVIHHIDGDKTNNNIDNLDLCTVQEHNACHGATESIVFELYRRGLVGYDRLSKRYFLK